MLVKIGKNKKKFRKFLYEHEIAQVLELCQQTRFPLRNETLLLITYNHAYRAAEVCNLQWNHLDFHNNTITIERQKGGVDSIHPMGLKEKDLLLKMREERDENCPYVFTSFLYGWKLYRAGTQFEPQNLYRLCLKLGQMANFDFPFTPHMLRHSKGTYLAEKDINIFKIKNYLGHRRISSTEYYIHLAANQFQGINEGSIFM
jgi:integrase